MPRESAIAAETMSQARESRLIIQQFLLHIKKKFMVSVAGIESGVGRP